jgi:TolA-binding protein
MNRIARSTCRTLILAAFAAAACAPFLQASAADGDAANWDKNHPRRAEVNARLANQNRRINKEVREGEMSKGQAAQLHRQDHQIRKEERTMASMNGGHITKSEQRALNQQENHVSREIGR